MESKRKGLSWWQIVLIILLLAAGYKIFFSKKQVPGGPAAGNKKDEKVIVKAIVVRSQEIKNKVYASGTVLPNDVVEVRSEVSGRVTKILFKEGTHVQKGELLIKLYDTDLQAQLSKLSLQTKLAEEKEFREKKLLDAQAVSKEEYDVVENQLSGLKADLQILKSQIEKTEIRAPFNGTIGLKYVSEGAYITPAIKIASIQNIDPIKIDFSIPEKYMGMVKKNDMINFSLQNSDAAFTGKVYAIEPMVDLATRTIQIRAICGNEKGTILPGSFAKVQLDLNDIEGAILVPTEAIIPELKGQKVFIKENGKAISRPVETGLRTDTEIQITKGLAEGDTVITSGIMQLKPNANVKIIELKKQ